MQFSKSGDQILIVKDLSLENLYSIFTVSGAESENYDIVSVFKGLHAQCSNRSELVKRE